MRILLALLLTMDPWCISRADQQGDKSRDKAASEQISLCVQALLHAYIFAGAFAGPDRAISFLHFPDWCSTLEDRVSMGQALQIQKAEAAIK